MKKMLLVWIAAVAGLLPSLSPKINESRLDQAPAWLSSSLGESDLLCRVPGSALVAVSAFELDQRWGDIRKTPALADLQDVLLSENGLQPDLFPRLVGRRSVFFLAPADQWPFAVPVGLLEPTDAAEAETILSRLPDVASLRDGPLVWVGPADSQELLLRLSRDEGLKFAQVVPLGEIEDRLPPGGLLRGCLNAAACMRLLHDSAIDRCPFPFRSAAAALAADLSTVRYVAFRRDLVQGELTMDGLAAYDPTRLPPEVSEVLNPAASPVLLPAAATLSAPDGSARSPFMIVAFRPESRAWLPWVRYVAASDPRGPLRNLGFWLEEFQRRYARDLDRDLLSVIGDEAWLLASPAVEGSVDLVLVFELRGHKAVEGVLEDLFSWAGEQVWLGSFGLLSTRPWQNDRPSAVASGLTLRTPFLSFQGPAFEVAGRYLVVALQPSGLETGREWIRNIEAARVAAGQDSNESHGTILVQPSELARVVRAIRPAGSTAKDERLWDAVLELMADSGTLRVDLKYEPDAIRFHGHLPIGERN